MPSWIFLFFFLKLRLLADDFGLQGACLLLSGGCLLLISCLELNWIKIDVVGAEVNDQKLAAATTSLLSANDARLNSNHFNSSFHSASFTKLKVAVLTTRHAKITKHKGR